MPVIGLTGGIACGKSAVARMFADLGAIVISSDDISREVVEPGGSTLECIRLEFGEGVLFQDGSLNRKLMGEIIFRDPAARKRLEEITHPAIKARIREKVKHFYSDLRTRCIVVEAPLLFEANMQSDFDKVVVVTTSRKTQIKRLMHRDGIDLNQAELRLNAQMPLDEKCSRADIVVKNDGSLKDLKKEILKVWQELCGDAVKKPSLPELGS